MSKKVWTIVIFFTIGCLTPLIFVAKNSGAQTGTITGTITGGNCTGIQVEIKEKKCSQFEEISLYVQTGDDCRYLIGGLKNDKYQVQPMDDYYGFYPYYQLVEIKDNETIIFFRQERNPILN